MRVANLAVRFVLELCALAALGYWGLVTGTQTVAKIGLGVGAPLLAILVWARWVAPKARHRLADPWRLVPEFVVWGGAAAALWAVGRPALAASLLLVAVIGRLLMAVLGGEPTLPR